MLKKIFFVVTSILFLQSGFAQNSGQGKYPSLLWEITGNGLTKPSYLFGTMHVSSKLAFHLSDSFYYAIRNTDAVALELNPDIWQAQMAGMEKLKLHYSNYVRTGTGHFITENSFRIKNYEDKLKLALSTEPNIVNNLLYRSFKPREDFEEDTFLDLYIFQTGKKLGKRGTGVENYYETEKIVLEAYGDMAKEKKKKAIDMDGESMMEISEKMQDAYKRGDLDLMDSLDNKLEQSAAFREKFLYLRNEIQANSIDSIMKKSALFVGVGCAHLPGERGVIELLRKKGYILRPVKMANRNARQKELVDKLKVPVVFNRVQAEDGFFSVEVPGQLYDVPEEYVVLNRKQYSDMSNGSFYQVTRVKTHAAFFNQSEATVKKKVDSLLYENIPGKIIKKMPIVKNGYAGFDITSKTRRGDLQRYNILVTPFEILIFKMSGKENYINGKEATQFFSSILLKERSNTALSFSPPQGGFSVQLPQQPFVSCQNSSREGTIAWEYEAASGTNDKAYLIYKKSLYNYDFLEEDTFELSLLEESFRSPDYFERQISRKQIALDGYPSLEVQEKMKDSSVVTVRYIIQGPHYYVLAVRGETTADRTAFFNSFRFAPYKYASNAKFVDSFMQFSVASPIVPVIDTGYRAVIEKLASAKGNYYNEYNNYSKSKTAFFSSDSTGESISVSIEKFDDYYFAKDTASFWKKRLSYFDKYSSMVIHDNLYVEKPGGVSGYTFSVQDTGSSKKIYVASLLKNNYLFTLLTMGDTLSKPGYFVNSFYNSFTPGSSIKEKNIFINPLDSFFTHLFSTDSSTRAKAEQSITEVHFGEAGLPKLMDAIKKLAPSYKKYFEIKTRLIAELAYIKDTTKPMVVDKLLHIYNQSADTSMFQHQVVEALARHKTREATLAFKNLVLQDPLVYDNDYSTGYVFASFEDSLQLAALLYPEILQLASVEDYKAPLMELLVTLVDSNLVQATQYEGWFDKILFDAKIALKKQKGSDDKKMEADSKKDEDEESYTMAATADNKSNIYSGALREYAVLLAPFYYQKTSVPAFFNKLLLSKNDMVRLNTSIVLLQNKVPVPDSIINALAAKDNMRGRLYSGLEKIKQPEKFPVAYKSQEAMARSYLLMDKGYEKIDSLVLLGKHKTGFKTRTGWVYFYQYRVNKEDDWKMGISGLQPENETLVSSDDALSSMTEKKLKDGKPVNEQFQEQLKRLLFLSRPSARNFFEFSNEGRRHYIY